VYICGGKQASREKAVETKSQQERRRCFELGGVVQEEGALLKGRRGRGKSDVRPHNQKKINRTPS